MKREELLKIRYPLKQRPRRNRKSESIRRLVSETSVSLNDLVMPYFLIEGRGERQAIGAMPGQFRWSADLLVEQAKELYQKGVRAIALFPALPDAKKNAIGSESWNRDGLLPTTVKRLKDATPELLVITDVALDPYSSDGHDGIVEKGEILNDPTLEVLAKMALVQAEAGADFVAPSDMMDGRVRYLRERLDEAGFSNVGILSYAAKYASAFYGPFREALDSAPRSGDKKSYQMDPANRREALLEVALDIREGADMVMVKPALAYLDIIALLRRRFAVPVVAYQVSGEYSMIKLAAQAGVIDERAARDESLLGIKRAGADIIFSYFTADIARENS